MQVAERPESVTEEHPAMAFTPLRNCTVPVGVPALPVTEAVKVMLAPAAAGLLDEASETDGSAFGVVSETVKA